MTTSIYRSWRGLSQKAITVARERERFAFDEQYRRETFPPRLETHETFVGAITPPHKPGGSPGGLPHARVWSLLAQKGLMKKGRTVLDYGCGLGKWSIRIAQEGATVVGFDLSPVAIETATQRAKFNNLPIRFDVADAGHLPYVRETFDAVVGIGTLHHVIKYPNTAEELYRVMRPGAIAVFSEGLSHNPLIELARRVTMRNESALGDVALTVEAIEEWAAGFPFVIVESYSLTYMVKRIVGWRWLLRLLYKLDSFLLHRWPALGRYCGECVVVIFR